MYERYHIATAVTPGRHTPVPKFIVRREGNCINCGKCERMCVYLAHKRDPADPRRMADPDSTLCKNCFRCVVECPQRALSIKANDEFKALGYGVWTPVRISTMWGEAENAKIPVLGAGYRGPFSAPGFDSMWTDMSEIVRPTRDGIHGREFISTGVDIGRKPTRLQFDEKGGLRTDMGVIIDLPVPFMLDLSRLAVSENVLKGVAGAANALGTLMVVPFSAIGKVIGRMEESMIVPVLDRVEDIDQVPNGVRLVEIEAGPNWKGSAGELKRRRPGLLVGIRIGSSPEMMAVANDMAREADVIHVLFAESGMGSDGLYARDALRRLHRQLVAAGLRDQMTIVSSGGLAAAEMVPKSVICGADAVTLENALKVALGCHVCVECGNCPADVENSPEEFVRQRVINMCSAWRDQMLEMLGAMGIRDLRRLRGETGRAIFQEDAHRDAFSGIEGGERNE